MTIGEHLTTFAGKPVRDYDPEVGIDKPTGSAYRVAVDYEAIDAGGSLVAALGPLLADPAVGRLEALVLGQWDYDSSESCEAALKLLCDNAGKLPALRALFVGDITYEEQEMSWIKQCDVSPVLTAFPELRELRVRGGDGLAVSPVFHAKLETLALETGGMRPEVVAGVAKLTLPELRHLELWLGDDNYGYADCSAELGPILAARRFPALRYLGLKNCCEQDKIAELLAAAPIVAQLEELDLGMGTLSDAGAQALLGSAWLRKLKRLSFAHHYVSDALVAQLAAAGVEVDASDRQGTGNTDESDRYVAVSE
jgi:hypothetical protein